MTKMDTTGQNTTGSQFGGRIEKSKVSYVTEFQKMINSRVNEIWNRYFDTSLEDSYIDMREIFQGVFDIDNQNNTPADGLDDFDDGLGEFEDSLDDIDSLGDFDDNIVDFDDEEDENKKSEGNDKPDASSILRDYIDLYYKHNPFSILPLLLLTLQKFDKVKVSHSDEFQPGALLCLSIDELLANEWIMYNENEIKYLQECKNVGNNYITLEAQLDAITSELLVECRKHDKNALDVANKNLNLLPAHSKFLKNSHLVQDYVTWKLVDQMFDCLFPFDDSCYIDFFDYICKKAQVMPYRTRMDSTDVLVEFLEYDNEGLIYYPFAGIGYVNAALKAGNNMIADASDKAGEFIAGQLLNYATNGGKGTFKRHDSKDWIWDIKPDYVISTYRGYVNGKTALSFCLEKCRQTISNKGKYVGIITSNILFEEMEYEVQKAIDDDLLESIVNVGNNESVVVFNWNKKSKGIVTIYKRNPWYIDDNHDTKWIPTCISNRDIVTNNYSLKNYITKPFVNMDGQELVKVCDYLEKIDKISFTAETINTIRSNFVTIDNSFQLTFSDSRPTIMTPMYKLDESTVVFDNSQDLIRVEDSILEIYQYVYLEKGMAFRMKEKCNWLINELSYPCATEQLFPYGKDTLMPNIITENQVLNLQVYRNIHDDSNEQSVEIGLPVKDSFSNVTYTIVKYLDSGYFGEVYQVNTDLSSENYVMKVLKPQSCDDTIQRFITEAVIMQELGKNLDNHIMDVKNVFFSEELKSWCYIMKYYEKGSLLDYIQTNGFLSEDQLIDNVVKPILKALSVIHKNNITHFDIKPQNIMLDDKGCATLTDFGVAKFYDCENTGEPGANGTESYMAPELREEAARNTLFDPYADYFSVAVTLAYALMGWEPSYIVPLTDMEQNYRAIMQNYSPQIVDAIIKGLQESPYDRPQSAQEFLNMFPRCENIKL